MKITVQFALACSLVANILTILVIIKDDRPKKYDYIIDLKEDNIEVFTKHGETYIVQPDSLDEFIVKDNL